MGNSRRLDTTTRSRITGAAPTQTICSVDYLSITFKAQPGLVDDLQRLVCGERGWLPQSGIAGYATCLTRESIMLCYDGNRDTVWLNLSGSACRQVESYRNIRSEDGWMGLLSSILDLGGHVKRLDIAFDDVFGLLSMRTIKSKMRGCVVGHFRKAWDNKKLDLMSGEIVGNAAVFGTKASDVQVVIYDKAREQAERGTPVDHPWIRVELRGKRDYAHALSAAFCSKGYAAALSDLRKRLQFKVKNPSDSNSARWKDCLFWRRFTGDGERALVHRTCNPLSVEDRMRRETILSARRLMNFAEEQGLAQGMDDPFLAAVECSESLAAELVRPRTRRTH